VNVEGQPTNLAGRALVDSLNVGNAPFFDTNEKLGSGNEQVWSADDNPNLYFGGVAGRPGIFPAPGAKTVGDVSYLFFMNAVWHFPDQGNTGGVIYFLGKADYSVRYNFELVRLANGNIDLNQTKGLQNNGINGTTGFTRDNSRAEALRPPIPNEANAGWSLVQ
jgi:hypothetical protein